MLSTPVLAGISQMRGAMLMYPHSFWVQTERLLAIPGLYFTVRQSVLITAQNFIEGGSTDRELIQIDFTHLNSQVKKIVFVLTINDALKNRLHFGMLKDAYIRIMDQSGKELVSFLMTEYYNNVISMMIGELYLHNDAWKFNAIGNGVAKDLAGLCELYGVQVL